MYKISNYKIYLFFILVFIAIAGSGKPNILGYDSKARFFHMIHMIEGENSFFKYNYNKSTNILNNRVNDYEDEFNLKYNNSLLQCLG